MHHLGTEGWDEQLEHGGDSIGYSLSVPWGLRVPWDCDGYPSPLCGVHVRQDSQSSKFPLDSQ